MIVSWLILHLTILLRMNGLESVIDGLVFLFKICFQIGKREKG